MLFMTCVFFFVVDSEIKKCTENLGKDECVKCPASHINPFRVSSTDSVRHQCFKKINEHEQCPLGKRLRNYF